MPMPVFLQLRNKFTIDLICHTKGCHRAAYSRNFHLKNGAKELQVNETSQNFEYDIELEQWEKYLDRAKKWVKIYKSLFSIKLVINLTIKFLIYKFKQENSNYFIVQYFKKNNKFGICNYPNISAIYFIDMNV